VTASSVVEAVPRLKGQAPRGHPPGITWDNLEGGFIDGKVIVGETYVDETTGLRVQNKAAAQVLRHELGHGYDYAGDIPLSAQEEFLSAWASDAAELVGKQEVIGDLEYALGLPPRGPAEAFSELFAALQGGGMRPDLDFLGKFPRSAEVLRKLLESDS